MKLTTKNEKRIVIVGGGFGGIRCALDVAKKKLPNTKILLISNSSHFEYHAALYRVVTGRSPSEVCIPLRDIFSGSAVEVVEDYIDEINLGEKKLTGRSGSRYAYDFLVLAVGSETAYFAIPGLKELSFGFKSIREALTLKKHLHELFTTCEHVITEEKICAMHIVIIGGGASGTEIAGELAVYLKQLAKKHHLKPSFITIDLIEASSRLLPLLTEDVSKKVKKRLHGLGVNIFLNRMVVEEEIEKIYLKDMEMKTKTAIWTAGVKPNHLYSRIDGFLFDKKGRVIVDNFLQPKEFNDVYILGDGASTPFTGMAQTAVHDGNFVANTIEKKIYNIPLESYEPRAPFYSIPIGPDWAVFSIGNFRLYGKIGWWLRRLADFLYFLSILPFKKALLAFRSGKTLCESCAICST